MNYKSCKNNQVEGRQEAGRCSGAVGPSKSIPPPAPAHEHAQSGKMRQGPRCLASPECRLTRAKSKCLKTDTDTDTPSPLTP